MREEIKITKTEKDILVNEIIELEWDMFDKVNNEVGRAGCQDDEWTFYTMRYSQFAVFSTEVLKSYRQDIYEAISKGRNLITEKYGYMMEYTDPEYFDKVLRNILPQVSHAKGELVDKTANLLIGCEREFSEKYSAMAGKSRPLLGNDRENVSFHIYAIGELKTYSEKTLELYYKHLQEMISKSENPSFIIHKKTTEFYGYKSLEDAERRIKNI